MKQAEALREWIEASDAEGEDVGAAEGLALLDALVEAYEARERELQDLLCEATAEEHQKGVQIRRENRLMRDDIRRVVEAWKNDHDARAYSARSIGSTIEALRKHL